MERVVPCRQHLVTQPDHVPYISSDRLLEKVRLAAFGVDMGVGPEERHENAGLVPSHKKLMRRIAKETADIRCYILAECLIRCYQPTTTE